MHTTDDQLRRILTQARSFACIGVSPDPVRPSNYVARYLSRRGYRVVPVNPRHAGGTLFGEPVVADVADAAGPVDVLDVFRRPEAVPAIVAAAIAARPELRCVWLQIGVVSVAARDACAAAGIDFVEDRCPKIEHQRLFGELRKGGFATGVISSRLP